LSEIRSMNLATLRSLAFSLSALALGACGMDDGPIFDPDAGTDAGPMVDSGTDAGDREPPTVVSTTPAQGASDVAPSTDIVIQFSEAMDEEGTLTLTAGGEAVSPTRAWSAGGTTLTLSAPLPSSARVRLVIERDFTDRA